MGYPTRGIRKIRLRGFGVVNPNLWLGFEDLGLGRARARAFEPEARQGSRIQAWNAPGFEDSGLAHAGVQGFGAGVRQGSRI